MKKWLRRLAKLVGAVILLSVVVLGFLLVSMYFSLPTSETLAQWYLGEVVNSTENELNTPFLRCSAYYFNHDRNLYGGAETRNVQIEVVPGTGSSDTIRFLTLTFEYRLPGSAEWQAGMINTLSTDFFPLRTRKLFCMF